MSAQVWSYFLYFYSFFYQLIDPCSNPEQLLVNSVDRQQYLGKWFFKAAVSHREADIHKFRVLDSIVFTMEETSNNTLVLTGHMRIGDDCMKQTWTYQIHPEREELLLEGRPQRRNLLWSGMWANCPNCIVFQEVEPPLRESDSEDSLNRYMLYARQTDSDSDITTSFVKNSACRNLKQSIRLPQEKEFCF
ncbi:apolipoprotein M isoform X2 [Austrofundulus limnaeus]|uniref:Apolipoprotein M n=1 Tax=Austrofundulus limnaeus TaxID=52670 RepID=A0A2I4CPE9_AUSLI|nr:PREDICTED: apolipoprotein M isoform X2 [Austrofundulus limnaeus]